MGGFANVGAFTNLNVFYVGGFAFLFFFLKVVGFANVGGFAHVGAFTNLNGVFFQVRVLSHI